MTPQKLIRLGAGLQRLANRVTLGYRWKSKEFIEEEARKAKDV